MKAAHSIQSIQSPPSNCTYGVPVSLCLLADLLYIENSRRQREVGRERGGRGERWREGGEGGRRRRKGRETKRKTQRERGKKGGHSGTSTCKLYIIEDEVESDSENSRMNQNSGKEKKKMDTISRKR